MSFAAPWFLLTLASVPVYLWLRKKTKDEQTIAFTGAFLHTTSQYELSGGKRSTRRDFEDPLNIKDFLEKTKIIAKELEMDEKFISRELNVGFSGGEKKKNEIFQMSMINPELAILDEIDSGLDIDSMRIIAKGINNNRGNNKSILMITHYQRLLDYVKPDSIHIIYKGKIVKSGGFELVETLEQRGYKEFYDIENKNVAQ